MAQDTAENRFPRDREGYGSTVGDDVPFEVARRLANKRQIARISGLSMVHVSRSLKGQNGLTFHTAAVIAEAADVRLDHLYNYILMSGDLVIRSRPTRTGRAQSVLAPVDGDFPEKPVPPKIPIPHQKRAAYKDRPTVRRRKGNRLGALMP